MFEINTFLLLIYFGIWRWECPSVDKAKPSTLALTCFPGLHFLSVEQPSERRQPKARWDRRELWGMREATKKQGGER